MNNQKYNDSKSPVGIKILIILVLTVIILWASTGYILYYCPNRGTFGDMFGTISALFTGLAFAGIIYAILLQRKDLELQRHELSLTREELEGQKNQLQAQNETLTKQTFEGTFFQLIQLHNDIVNSIIVRENEKELSKGRECFEKYYNHLKMLYTKHTVPDKEARSKGYYLEIIDSTYSEFFNLYEASLGHYFRNLYNIIKFIKNSEINNKRTYTNLIRAQLSSYELALLFYDCLSKYGRDKFKPIVEEYALLNNLPQELVFDPRHLGYFNKIAFQSLDETEYSER